MKHTEGFGCYAKVITDEIHVNNASTNTAVGHHHTGMKIMEET